MLQIGQQIQARVEKLILSGKGLIRYDGWVIFVDGVAANEEVLVTITKQKKSYFIAKLDKVIVKSENRIIPHCKYFDICGGCQLQHINYQQQLNTKKMWVEETLSRIGKVKIPPSFVMKPAKKIFEYRIKITLHFSYIKGKLKIGYFSRDTKELFDVDSCPIFLESKEPYKKIRSFLENLQMKEDSTGDILIIKGDEGQLYLRFSFNEAIPKNISSQLHHLNFAKVWIDNYSDAQKKENHKFLSMNVRGIKILYSPYVFLQAHFDESIELYEEVISHIQNLAPKVSVLDLYSGIGILSLLLAKQGHKVIGIESNQEAVNCAKGAKKNSIDNAVFYDSTVENLIQKIASKEKSPCWILNPPRTGLSEKVISKILSFLPEICIYISCSPATLGRDILSISENYELYHISSYDMFPQTTHLESVAILKKKTVLVV